METIKRKKQTGGFDISKATDNFFFMLYKSQFLIKNKFLI